MHFRQRGLRNVGVLSLRVVIVTVVVTPAMTRAQSKVERCIHCEGIHLLFRDRGLGATNDPSQRVSSSVFHFWANIRGIDCIGELYPRSIVFMRGARSDARIWRKNAALVYCYDEPNDTTRALTKSNENKDFINSKCFSQMAGARGHQTSNVYTLL